MGQNYIDIYHSCSALTLSGWQQGSWKLSARHWMQVVLLNLVAEGNIC